MDRTMKLPNVFCFCVLLGCSIVSGTGQVAPKQGALAGHVRDIIEAAPIPYAYVFLHSGGGKMAIAKVNAAGWFEVRLSPGYYDVFSAAAGFAPVCERVEIIAGETTRLTLRMGPHLPTS